MGLWLDGQRNNRELSSRLCNVISTLVGRSVDVCLICDVRRILQVMLSEGLRRETMFWVVCR